MKAVHLPGAEPRTVAQVAAALAREAAHDPATRLRALAALRPHLQGVARDIHGAWLPAALHRYARTLHHVREPAALGGEVVTSPELTAHLLAGDCEDVAALIAAYAASMGAGAAVGHYATGPASAHVVAAVTMGWRGGEPWWVVDPGRAAIVSAKSVEGARWITV